MKYEKFKLMTKEHQEEYNYKFKNNNIILPDLLQSSIVLLLAFVLALSIMVAFFFIPDLGISLTFKSYFYDIFNFLVTFIKIMIIATIIEYYLLFIYLGFKFYSKYRWLKKNGYNN